MKIQLQTIPHSNQRYDTVGDYWTDEDGCDQIRVSEMGNPDFEFLVSIHEQIEQHLTRKRGISEESITAFDKAYEANRPEGDESEPGDHPMAPYRKEHFVATNIERILAAELNVDWAVYDHVVNSL